MHTFVQELCLTYCADTLYCANIMNMHLSTLFLVLLQDYSGCVTASYTESTDRIPDQIVSVIHYIEENYIHTSLKETAEYFGYSADYLNLLFKKATAMSIGDMILKLKMEKAARLLRETDLPVSAIAEYLSYQNPASLARCFKKFSGMTPVQYRKEHGGG